ncbi:TetR/AcrR family transcriptional regulator [Aquisediminimonas sediminicola]|uniref:TetR/AcrR family transcriptional regulator n=1 Tax=Alteraquisediminimonas sediminicola TaxID=2676787 RepID=UPI001C8EEF00|nr:TetR/AcrR family transcriptional regulator [Aquisediminimonas sediminicola]
MPRGKPLQQNPPANRDNDAPLQSIKDEVTAIKVERIIRESADLFFRNGYTQTKMSDIADSLGATKPFVYNHFDSKSRILIEICERGTRDALEAAETAIEGKTSPSDKFEAFVRAFANAVLDDYKFVLIYFREELNIPPDSAEKITQMRKRINKILLDILSEGLKAGAFKINDPKLSALIITGMASYAFAWYRGDGRFGKDTIIAEIVSSSLKLVL